MTKEERKKYMKEWRLKNKEKIKEYREKNKEKIKEQKKEYNEKNYEKNLRRDEARLAETSYAPKHKELWTEDEIVRILNPKMTLKELAKEIGRSEGAIITKRVRLRKLGYKLYVFKK